MTPPITREARDYLLDRPVSELVTALSRMPLSPADPLDAIRARWQPKTRGGQEYWILGERSGRLYGGLKTGETYTSESACSWESDTGRAHKHGNESSLDLLPVSPHAALIAELKTVDMHQPSEMYSLCKRAADALEKLP